MIREEQQALKDIAALLPAGYVKTVPFSVSKDISFEFGGVTVKMSALYLNEYLNCYMFDLAWGADSKVFGIPVRGGVDLLSQYKTPLPNMYASNVINTEYDVTSWRQLFMFIIDESVLERV